MKNTLTGYLSKFLLVSSIVVIVFVLFIHSGPRLLYNKFLNMEVSQQYATVTKIIEENHITTPSSEHYNYDIMLGVNIDDEIHDIEFKLETTEPIYIGTDYLVEYYSNSQNSIIMYYTPTIKVICEDVNNAKRCLLLIPCAVFIIWFIIKTSNKKK